MQRSLTDTAKIFAAIAVVGIHATSTAEYNFSRTHEFFSLDFLGIFVNQCARFSVPLFLYLSAYGLARSDKTHTGSFVTNYVQFLAKRLPTILVPYLFFSAIALAMQFSPGQAQNQVGNFTDFAMRSIDKLRTGGADYHLYFLVILAQCYLLFPLLVRIHRGAPQFYRVFSWLSLLLVAALLYKGSSEVLLPKLGLAHPAWHASFCIYWLPYFMLGVLHAGQTPLRFTVAAGDDSAEPRLWKSITMSLLVLIALALVIAEYIHNSRQVSPVDYYNHFSRPSVMLYALAVVYLLHTMSPSRPPPPFGKLRAGSGEAGTERSRGVPQAEGESYRVATLARLTFSVYLIHPQVLRLLTNYAGNLPGIFSWIITVLATFALVYGLTLVTNKAAQKSPAWLAGPVQFLQRCLGLR